MALRNIFKKRKKKEEVVLKDKRVEEKHVEAEDLKVKKPRIKKEFKSTNSYGILKFPHITEKASFLSEKNKYVFQAFKRANKNEIKKAIEGIFGVDVLKIGIVNLPKKPRRMGRQIGYKSGYKKAIVTIKKGQKIEMLPR
ncbi:MAG: 50S ribosomal protein L23 [Patescibacteria group bacterium]